MPSIDEVDTAIGVATVGAALSVAGAGTVAGEAVAAVANAGDAVAPTLAAQMS